MTIQDKPSISTVLSRLDVNPGRRGRCQCPIHQGDNHQAFSYDDDKGRWYCFRCGIGGDVIKLVMLALDLDFKSACRWLNIESGRPPKPDPATEQRRRVRDGLRLWAKQQARAVNNQLFLDSEVEFLASEQLRRNPDNLTGWILLEDATKFRAQREYLSDLLTGDDTQKLDAYRALHPATRDQRRAAA